MFCSKKKTIELLCSCLDKQRTYCGDITYENMRLKKQLDNLKSILTHYSTNACLGFWGENDEIVALQCNYICNFHSVEFELYLFNLYNCFRFGNWLVKADIEIRADQLEIVNLDASTYRKGYGTKCLEIITEWAITNRIKSIHGMLWDKSPIGKDNLIRFYKKNGFNIKETTSGIFFTKEL